MGRAVGWEDVRLEEGMETAQLLACLTGTSHWGLEWLLIYV